LAADGYDSVRSHLSPVATCRQTVEALLAPYHRLAADGYDSARSHLSKRKDAWGEEGNAKARRRKDAGTQGRREKGKVEERNAKGLGNRKVRVGVKD
jgi:hypothetical protein